jgi:hypothetical protein
MDQGTLGSILWIFTGVTLIELYNGRSFINKQTGFNIWCGDIWAKCNSQWLFDPYSFSHIIHGFLFYIGINYWCGSTWSFSQQLLLATGIESLWEVTENSNWLINRYRRSSTYKDYNGDTVINSLSDIFCGIVGFWIAYWYIGSYLSTFLIACSIDLATYLTIGDSLVQNIYRIINPEK